ncbi:MAG: PEP-CTERM sorting domain-containing protein [Planctomycetota bacterium]
MKSLSKSSASGKLRVQAYIGACTAWAASGHQAVADPVYGFFDSGNPVTINAELSDRSWVLGDAGDFNFILDPRDVPGQNPNNGSIFAAKFDENGFVPTELKFSTIGTAVQLSAGYFTDYYYGAALRRYVEGEQIDGAAILGAGGATDYTAGYLFQFDQPTGSAPNGNFNTSNPNFEGFVGFAFRTSPTDPIYSGWIYIQGIAGDYSSYDILDWYYATGTVNAGDGRPSNQPQETVPEPSSLGLLAAGAAGLLRYRRRRRPSESVEAQPAA